MKVSIIIPIYNVESKLNRCLASVVNQTYKNLEIILINDGSTDNSGVLCEEFKKVDDRIIIIHQENKGLSGARNSGMKNLSGDYLYFLDSDDYIEFKAIEILVERASRTNADIVIGNYSIVNEKNEITKRNQFEKEVFTEDMWNSSSERFKYFFGQSYGTTAWNKLYRVDFLNRLNIDFERNDLIFAEDLLFNMKIFLNFPHIEMVNQYTYFYYKVSGSITTTYKPDLAKRYINLLESFYNYANETNKINDTKDLILYYTFTAIDNTCLNEYEYSDKIYKEIKKNLLLYSNNSLIFKSMNDLSKGRYLGDVPRKDWKIYVRIFSKLYTNKLFGLCSILEIIRFRIKKYLK
jgi:glycosyltransferase involved in cell wall biosynthesis